MTTPLVSTSLRDEKVESIRTRNDFSAILVGAIFVVMAVGYAK